ncbi:MAG: PASTA domain-containing protein [Bacillati bacterium ANGP1]|uniref:PASTA domain-containing protein n=1 Tax=Candidatus Segetimicrobium genomatis TaxID=2569760 RepID=A0A537K5V2_9BACT|nr:MAG: PASTA domain-containing protein [Terrabacteria group bacterium ANGP1]
MVGRDRPAEPQEDGAAVPRPSKRVLMGTVILAACAVWLGTLAVAAQRAGWGEAHLLPSLLGRTVDSAAEVVVPLHFGVIVAGFRQDPHAPVGVILAQDPAPGRLLFARSVIQLTISQGSGVVPALRHMPVHKAAQQLEATGLRLGRVYYLNDDTAPGTVLEQFVPPGRQVAAGGPVDVMVSTGPDAPAGPAAWAGPSAPASPIPPDAPPARPQIAASIQPGRAGAAPTPTDREGCCRARPASGDRSTDPERKRPQVRGQPADDGGTQPDVYRSEHRDVPAGP